MDSSNCKNSSSQEPFLAKSKIEFLTAQEREAIRQALDHFAVFQKYRNGKFAQQKPVEKSGGVCRACQKFTSHKCPKCNDYYCSSDCQHLYWKKHDARCNKTPSLDIKSQVKLISPTEPKSQVKLKSPIEPKSQVKLKSPTEPTSQVKLKSPTEPKSQVKLISPPELKSFAKPKKELRSPPFKRDTEADEKQMRDSRPYPSANHGQFFRRRPGTFNGTGGKDFYKKSEPAMGRHLVAFRHRDDRRPKRFSLTESELRYLEYANEKKRSFINNSQINTLPMGRWSSTETESVSNSTSSRKNKSKAKNKKKDSRASGAKEEKRVVFFYKEPDKPVHWVMDECDMKDFEWIFNTLARECDKYETIEPEEGLVCGCKYLNEWYRARVINLFPKHRIHYIDYGNTEEVQSAVFKKLPPEIKKIKNLVYSIEFDEETPEKYRNKDLSGKTYKIKTKGVNKSGGEIVELVLDYPRFKCLESDTAETETIEPRRKHIGSAMNLIQSGSKGIIAFLPGDSKIRFGLIIPDRSENDIGADVNRTKILDIAELCPVKANEGDYVLVVDHEGQKRRGIVVSKLCSTYYVSIIDYGIIVGVEHVYELPGRKTNLVHLGTMVTIDEISSPEEVRSMGMAVYYVIGKEDSDGRWPCELYGTLSKEVIAKGYIQTPPDEGVTIPLCMPIESGSICEMSVVTGVRKCYIRPLNEKAARKCLEMSVKMAEFLLEAKPLSEVAKVGKMYAAKNKKDECFHRAVVKSVTDEKYKVLFVDHGTVEEVELKDLKPLPASIKVVPFFAAEVTLSGITVERLSDSAKEYLDTLISENMTLILSFSEGENDEVVLREQKSGVIVNEVIDNSGNGSGGEDEEKPDDIDDLEEDKENVKEENVQDRKSEARAKSPDPVEDRIITKKDLMLPVVSLNKKCKLVLQYVEEKEFFSTLTFWMANMDDDTFAEVSNVVNSWAGQNGNNAKEAYHPKEQEMCLALFEGYWYRAVTLSVTDDEYTVFFVDYGNTCTLKATEIRKMKPKFMGFPAWAFKCTVMGMGKLIGKPCLKRTVFKVLKRRMNTIIENVVVAKHEFDIYYVVIPEIQDILFR